MPRNLPLLALLICAPLTSAADWPQWLGPTRDGVSAEKVAPWEKPPKVLWRQPAGEGHSSPVVAAGRVYLHTKVADKNEEQFAAYDAATGKPLWQKTYERAAFKSQFGGGPRGTPAVAGGKVYTFGITGVLTCFAADSGQQLWQVDTLKEFQAPNLTFGVSCSPLVEDGRVFVNVGGKGASVVAFDTDSGKVAWKALDDRASYSSPIAFGKGTQRQVVFLTQAGLHGLNAADGTPLWQFPFKDALQESSATPVRINDLLVASSITRGGVALRLGDGGKPAVEPAWKNGQLNSYFATPVVVGKEHLYVVTGTNPLNFLNPLAKKKKKFEANLHCVEAAGGKVLWTREKVGTYHATLLRTGDGKLLLLEEGGSLVLLDPNPTEYRELARARVCGQTWAHPALADGRLFVRDGKELLCVQLAP